MSRTLLCTARLGGVISHRGLVRRVAERRLHFFELRLGNGFVEFIVVGIELTRRRLRVVIRDVLGEFVGVVGLAVIPWRLCRRRFWCNGVSPPPLTLQAHA